MQRKLTNILKTPYQRLKEPTKICKICFKEFDPNSLRTLFSKDISICDKCFQSFDPKFIKFKIDGVDALSVYEYDSTIKQFLYQFKGCYDIELASIFLEQYIKYIRLDYRGYIVVPIPSYHLDDEQREFNHVIEAFKALKLPMIKALSKTEKYKQSDHKASERTEIIKHLKLSEVDKLTNKNILIVDDVCTTGNTLKAAVSLIKQAHPKRIKILVIGHTFIH